MKRIDTATKATDLFGTGKHGFKDGQPPGVASTRLDAAWFNAAQEEICRLLEGMGMDIVPGTFDQMRQAKIIEAMNAVYFLPNQAPGMTSTLRAIAEDPVGFNYAYAVGDSGAIVAREGFAWAPNTADASYTDDFNDICYGGAAYGMVAVGDNGGIQTGVDGVWTARDWSQGFNDMNGVASSLTRVCAVGDAGIIRYADNPTSPGGVAQPTENYTSIAYGNGRWVIRGATTGLYYTNDGGATTIVECTGNPGPTEVFSVCYEPVSGYFFADNGYYSADGITWQSGGGWGPSTIKIFATRAGIMGFTETEYGARPFGGTFPVVGGAANEMPANVTTHAALSARFKGLWYCGADARVGFLPMPYGS